MTIRQSNDLNAFLRRPSRAHDTRRTGQYTGVTVLSWHSQLKKKKDGTSRASTMMLHGQAPPKNRLQKQSRRRYVLHTQMKKKRGNRQQLSDHRCAHHYILLSRKVIFRVMRECFLEATRKKKKRTHTLKNTPPQDHVKKQNTRSSNFRTRHFRQRAYFSAREAEETRRLWASRYHLVRMRERSPPPKRAPQFRFDGNKSSCNSRCRLLRVLERGACNVQCKRVSKNMFWWELFGTSEGIP